MTEKLSFLALPLGPDCHFGASAQIEQLLNSVENVSVLDIQRIESKLPGYFAYSYKVPRDPEQDYCKINLVEFLHIVKAEIKLEDDETSVDIKSEADCQRYFQTYLTKEGSKTDYCLVYRKGNKRLGLVAAEAKAAVHSSFQAVAQGVALAAEFAMDQVCKGFANWDEAMVVFVLSFGDSIQFGAVYILEDNFPCTTMLTRPLSLLLPRDRDIVSRWAVALGINCSQCANRVRKWIKKPANRCNLKSNIFLKPIVTDDIKSASFAMAQLLCTFRTLYEYVPCRDYILFPLGVMGMPDEDQVEGRARVMDCLIYQFKQGYFYESPGFPLVIYPKLDENWHNCEESIVELRSISEQFISQVRNIFDLVFAAGLIHLDGRLANFMFNKWEIFLNLGFFRCAPRQLVFNLGFYISASALSFEPRLEYVNLGFSNLIFFKIIIHFLF